MTTRTWRRLWSFASDGPDGDDSEAAVEVLDVDGVEVPGGLILWVSGADAEERWASLPYGDVRALRDALTEWLDRQG